MMLDDWRLTAKSKFALFIDLDAMLRSNKILIQILANNDSAATASASGRQITIK